MLPSDHPSAFTTPASAVAARGYQPIRFEDLITRVCRHMGGWGWDQVLDMPVQRFWRVLESVHREEQRLADQLGPLAALFG